jgi:hypothetical protein
MFFGLIGAVVCWFISKSILASVITFYLLTGFRKSRQWLGMAEGHPRYAFLPPMIQPLSIGSFIKGLLFWPIVLIGCRGDPSHQYFKELERSGMSASEIYDHLKKEDQRR